MSLSSHRVRPWARTLPLAAEDVGVLVEAAVSSVRDEAQRCMGTLRVDPLSSISAAWLRVSEAALLI